MIDKYYMFIFCLANSINTYLRIKMPGVLENSKP